MTRLAWIALSAGALLFGAWTGGWFAPSPPHAGPPPILVPPRVGSQGADVTSRESTLATPTPPRAEPRPEPSVEARPEPRAEARPEPRAEARPEPRAEARAEPRVVPIRPRFDVARVGRTGTLVTAGRAAPGAEVLLLENGREIGRGRADARGEWVILPDAPLAPGLRELSLRMRQPGAAPVDGEATVILLVPEVEVAAPARPEPTPEIPSARAEPGPAPLALLVPVTPGQPIIALQPAPSAPLSLQLVDYGPDGDLRFAGTAPAGAALRLYVNDVLMTEITADAAGRWNFAPGEALPPGRHTLRVDQLDAQGRVLSRIEQPFIREAALVLAAAPTNETRRIVQPGNSLWRISRETYGRGMRFTLIFAANREQIRDPNRIFPGQVFTLPAP